MISKAAVATTRYSASVDERARALFFGKPRDGI